MARSTITASPAPSLTREPTMSSTQAAASEALAALLARRRGAKPKTGRVRKNKSKAILRKDVDGAKDSEKEVERERNVERSVGILKRAGKVGDNEREIRRRILQMREEAREKKGKGKGKKKVVEEEEEYDSDK